MNTTRIWKIVAPAALLALAGCETLNQDWIGTVSSMVGGGTSGMTMETVAAGLKDALKVGTQNAVAQTSQKGGYARDAALRIPLPQELQGVAQSLRKIGLGSQVDALEGKMNEAAEAAAAQATPVFLGAIQQMTFDDAKKILHGSDSAATDYFREKTAGQLRDLYKPVVRKYTGQSGVAAAYDRVVESYNRIPFTSKPKAVPVEDYVTQKAVDGLFVVLAREEAKIRRDPAARTTELLKAVFGAGK